MIKIGKIPVLAPTAKLIKKCKNPPKKPMLTSRSQFLKPNFLRTKKYHKTPGCRRKPWGADRTRTQKNNPKPLQKTPTWDHWGAGAKSMGCRRQYHPFTIIILILRIIMVNGRYRRLQPILFLSAAHVLYFGFF